MQVKEDLPGGLIIFNIICIALLIFSCVLLVAGADFSPVYIAINLILTVGSIAGFVLILRERKLGFFFLCSCSALMSATGFLMENNFYSYHIGILFSAVTWLFIRKVWKQFV